MDRDVWFGAGPIRLVAEPRCFPVVRIGLRSEVRTRRTDTVEGKHRDSFLAVSWRNPVRSPVNIAVRCIEQQIAADFRVVVRVRRYRRKFRSTRQAG